MQEEALKELRAQRMEREKRAAEAKRQEEEAAKRRRDAEYAKMMAEYKKQEAVQVTDDGKKEETVMVTPSKPLAVPSAAPVAAKEEPMVTVTSDEGLSHSYPKRDFTPEKPKKEETVTLKTGGEIHDGSGWVADKAVLAGMGLAMTASMVLMMTRKFRSPVAAPEAGVALTSRMDDSAMLAHADLEDPEPIASEDALAESWASSAVDRALAAAEG